MRRPLGILGVGLLASFAFGTSAGCAPSEAELAQRKLKELGALVNVQKSSSVGFTADWRGKADDLRLLYDLPRLTEVAIQGGPFDDAMTAPLAGLPELKFLRIEHVAVTDAGLAKLAGCSSLGDLWLVKLPVTDRCLRDIAAMPNLKRLVLGDIRIRGEGLSDLGNAPRLESLTVSGVSIDDAAALSNLQSLASLREVLLGGNPLDTKVIRHLVGPLPQLQSLTIMGSLPANAGRPSEAFERIGSMPALGNLCLRGDWVSDEVVAAIVKANRLESLKLVNVAITDAALAHFHSLPMLRELSLERWAHPSHVLTDAALQHIRKIKNLALLNVQGNTGISEAALRRLWGEMPELRIVGPTGGPPASKGGSFGQPPE